MTEDNRMEGEGRSGRQMSMKADEARDEEAERGGWREREKYKRRGGHECCHVSWQEWAPPPKAHMLTVHLVQHPCMLTQPTGHSSTYTHLEVSHSLLQTTQRDRLIQLQRAHAGERKAGR